jgi:hypothetical protein
VSRLFFEQLGCAVGIVESDGDGVVAPGVFQDVAAVGGAVGGCGEHLGLVARRGYADDDALSTGQHSPLGVTQWPTVLWHTVLNRSATDFI